jgi:hypothetical protein
MEFNISKSIERFQEHISSEDNDRIIFSGKFGAGKTFFLNKFFEEKNADYCSVHIYPVNYSVASNEEVFELIKFDILFHLLGKAALEDDSRIPHEIMLYFFLQNKADNILPSLLGFIPKLGSQIQKGVEKAIELIKEYKQEKKEAEISDTERTEAYLKTIKDQKGNIYEEDLITKIIIDLIDSIRQKGKKVVLIVDDLDRIDPGHLFRILNVFSAHTDRFVRGDNKFGFDKIILTFHLENVKSIYHHQYGQRTDFEGYIDKFYTGIFRYHLKEGLLNRVEDIILSIQHKEDPTPFSFNKSNSYPVQNIIYILSSIIIATELTVRNTLKLYNREYEIPRYSIPFKALKADAAILFIFVLIDFLLELFPDTTSILKTIESTDFPPFEQGNRYNLEPMIMCSIPVINGDLNNQNSFSDENRKLTFDPDNITLTYTLRKVGRSDIYVQIHEIELGDEKYDDLGRLSNSDFYYLYKLILVEAVTVIIKNNLLANRPN